MKPQEDFVYFAYLDILGYKEYLSADIKNTSLEFKEKLVEASSVLNSINSAHYHHKEISDSIFIHSASVCLLEFLATVKKIFNHYLNCKLLLRGGISYSKHFENNSMTYSLALTEAYILESQHAIYPRVLIHSTIIDTVRNFADGGESRYLLELLDSKMVCVDGSLYFLNTIDDGCWDEYYNTVKDLYLKNKKDIDKNSNLRMKYIWLHYYIFSKKPKSIRKAIFIENMQMLSN